jgi:hypothetical protein
MTFEGFIEDGQIKLKTNIQLPDKIKVYVIVPDLEVEQVVHILSPRLAHPEQVADFKVEIVERPDRITFSKSNISWAVFVDSSRVWDFGA